MSLEEKEVNVHTYATFEKYIEVRIQNCCGHMVDCESRVEEGT